MTSIEPAALYSIKVSLEQFEAVASQIDCFTREGDPDQLYVDMSCTDREQDDKLYDILGLDEDECHHIYGETLMIHR